MSKHRFTVAELQKEDSKEYMSDLQVLRQVIYDRRMDCTNVYSPLYTRLKDIETELIQLINHGKRTIL